jgi:hypothetical protein
MIRESLTDFVPFENAGDASRLFADRQNIRVLIYTDDHKVNDTEDKPFGIGLLRKFLDAHQPAFGKVTLVRKNRNSEPCPGNHAVNTLTQLLTDGDGFDQVWFFGLHLADLTEVVCNNTTNAGAPESELTQPEVDFLRNEWMLTGGVFVTGDHSVPKPQKPVSSTLQSRLSLGRALAHRVPRARQLRTWDGGPVNDNPRLSYNTLEPDCGKDINDDDSLEGDTKPQNIILPRYDLSGDLDPSGKPHYLFMDDKCEITVFPDHMHEGELLDPQKIPFDKDWPVGGPKPLVVAVGTDKRTAKTYNLVTAYGGHNSDPKAGRIVADSTWHHYFNMNLTGLQADMSPGSAADRIGQYYGNLAVWLSSREKRQKMANAMFWWLYTRPRLMEEASSESLDVGIVARQILLKVASPCEIHELLLAYTPDSILAKYPALSYPATGSTLDPLPSQELILGSVVKQYFEAVSQDPISGEESSAIISRVITTGFKDAFNTHAAMLNDLKKEAKRNSDDFYLMDSPCG